METADLTHICDDRIFDKRYMIKLSLNKEAKSKILEATKWMDPKVPLKIRALVIKDGLTSETFPKCRICQASPVTYDKLYQKHLLDVCGSDCGRKERRLSKQSYECLKSYEWLYEQRFVNRKSFEDIASELGCSPHPVRQAAKRLGVPEIKHNESLPPVMSKLMDRNWLFEEHVVKRRKVRDIAEELSSSSATISRWIANHGIEANAPNSYDRKFNKISREEVEVLDFIKSIVPEEEIITSNRSILKGSELDIYLPRLKVAFEYNGNFSHVFRPECDRLSQIKGPTYHLDKTEACRTQGIRLIHIFSDDWKYRKEIWKSIIKSILGTLDHVYYARKLAIAVVAKSVKNQFLRDNHLQGNDRSTIAYGLFDENKLIAIMTMNKSRFNRHYTWELTRYCVSKNTNCVGGFSRLLKHFQKYHEGSVISYADYSRSNGDVYLKNGFDFLRKNPPSYAYIDFRNSEQRLHRSNFTKSKINCPDTMTEQEYMQLLGYKRIYDCGTIAFILG